MARSRGAQALLPSSSPVSIPSRWARGHAFDPVVRGLVAAEATIGSGRHNRRTSKEVGTLLMMADAGLVHQQAADAWRLIFTYCASSGLQCVIGNQSVWMIGLDTKS